jgi:antitoxin (DNA-binding transcriptional repressor) of toxin-antitoxin stability system
MLTKTIDVHEAQTNFTKLLALVLEGTEVILAQNNTLIARLVPIASPARPHVAGLHEEAIWTSYEERSEATDTAPFLLTIAGLGSSGQGDVAEHDEDILAAEIDPRRGWGLERDAL